MIPAVLMANPKGVHQGRIFTFIYTYWIAYNFSSFVASTRFCLRFEPFVCDCVFMHDDAGGFLPRTVELRLVRRPRQAEGAATLPGSASNATNNPKLLLARYTLDAATFAVTTAISKPKAPAAKPVTVRLTPTTAAAVEQKHNHSTTASSSALHSTADGELLVTVGCTYARPANTSEALAAAQNALATAEAAAGGGAVVSDSAAAAQKATKLSAPVTTPTNRSKAAEAPAQAPPLPPFPNQARATAAAPPVFSTPSTASSHAVDRNPTPTDEEKGKNNVTQTSRTPPSPPKAAVASTVAPALSPPSSPDNRASKDSSSSRQGLPPSSPGEAPHSSPGNGHYSSSSNTPERRLPAPSYADLSQVEQYRALTRLYNEANKAMGGSTETWSSPQIGPSAGDEPTTTAAPSSNNSHVNSPPGLIRRSGAVANANNDNDDSDGDGNDDDDDDNYSASFRERAANESYDSGLAALLVEVDSLVRSPDRHSEASLNSSNSHFSPKFRRGDGANGGGGRDEEAPDGVEAIMAEEARILEALSVDLEGMVVAARHGRHSNGSWSGGKGDSGTPPPLHGALVGGPGGSGNRGKFGFDDTFDSELSPLFLGSQWVEGAGDAKLLRSWLIRDVLPAHPTAARAFAAAAATSAGGTMAAALGSSSPRSSVWEQEAGSSLFEATADAIPNESGSGSCDNFVLDAGGSIVEEMEPSGAAAEPLGLDGVSTNALGRALGVTFELARRGDHVKTLALSQVAWDESEDDDDEEEEYDDDDDEVESDTESGEGEEGKAEDDDENVGGSSEGEKATSSGGQKDTGSPRSPERFPHSPEGCPAVPSILNASRCGAALSDLEGLVELSIMDAPALEGSLTELLAPLCRRHRRTPRRQLALDDDYVSNIDCAAEISRFQYEEVSDAYEGLHVLLLERCSALTGPLTATAIVGKQNDNEDEGDSEDDEDLVINELEERREEAWKEKVHEAIESMNGCLVGEDSDDQVAQEGITDVLVDHNAADCVPQSPVNAPKQMREASPPKDGINSRLTKAEAMAAAATANSCRAMFQELQEKNAKSSKNGTTIATSKSPGRRQAAHVEGEAATNSDDKFSISSSSAFREYSRSPTSNGSKKEAHSPWKSPLSRQALAQAEKAALTRGHRTAARLLAALPRPSPTPSPAGALQLPSGLPHASLKRRNWSLLELRLRHCDSLSGGLEALAALPALRVLDLRHTPLGSSSTGSSSSGGSVPVNNSESSSSGSSSGTDDHYSSSSSSRKNNTGNVSSSESENLCVAEIVGRCCPMLQELWLDNTLVDGPINALSRCTKLRILSAPHTNFFVGENSTLVHEENFEKSLETAGETQADVRSVVAAGPAASSTEANSNGHSTSDVPLSSEEESGCMLEVIDLGSTQVSGSLANLLHALGGGRRMCALKHLDLTHQESLGGSLAVFQSALYGPSSGAPADSKETAAAVTRANTSASSRSALQCLGLRGTAVEGDLSDLFPNLNSSGDGNGNGSREHDASKSDNEENGSMPLDSSRHPHWNPPCIHMLETIDVRGTAVTDAQGLAARLEDLAGCAVRMDHARTAMATATPRKDTRLKPKGLFLEAESTISAASSPNR